MSTLPERIASFIRAPILPRRLHGQGGAVVVAANDAARTPWRIPMARLTDTQLVILSAASQREDGGVELPANLKGEAARKLATSRNQTKGRYLDSNHRPHTNRHGCLRDQSRPASRKRASCIPIRRTARSVASRCVMWQPCQSLERSERPPACFIASRATSSNGLRSKVGVVRTRGLRRQPEAAIRAA